MIYLELALAYVIVMSISSSVMWYLIKTAPKENINGQDQETISNEIDI